MSGARGEWHGAARAAAEAVEAARDCGEQLGLFGDPERESVEDDGERRGRGRPKGSRNAAKLGLSAYMAAQGWRAPGHAVALAAGLAEDGDGLEIAFRRAAWLRTASGLPPDPGALASMAFAIWREQNAAAAQLLPYTLQRLAPVEAAKPADQRMWVGRDQPGSAPVEGAETPRLAPANVRMKVQQFQDVSDEARDDPDAGIRTEDASD